MDLVGHRHVKLRPRYAPWGRQIDLPDGLPFEPVLGLLFSHLRAPSSSLGGCSIGQRAYCRPWYSSSPMSLQHADATGSGSCPVVTRRLVGPASIPAAKRIAVFSSCRQSSSDFCAISIDGVGQRAGDFVAAGAVADLKHWAVKLFGKTHDIRSQKTGFKLKRASLLSELVGSGHPQDDKGDLTVFLAATRVIKVASWGSGPRGLSLCPVTCAFSCIAASTSRNVLTA